MNDLIHLISRLNDQILHINNTETMEERGSQELLSRYNESINLMQETVRKIRAGQLSILINVRLVIS